MQRTPQCKNLFKKRETCKRKFPVNVFCRDSSCWRRSLRKKERKEGRIYDKFGYKAHLSSSFYAAEEVHEMDTPHLVNKRENESCKKMKKFLIGILTCSINIIFSPFQCPWKRDNQFAEKCGEERKPTSESGSGNFFGM